MSKYTTGELAKLCDVSVRTVQYYDTRGILTPTALTEGGRRLYSQEDLRKLQIICFLRSLDLPIDSIKKLLEEEHSEKVISLVLEEQDRALRADIAQKQARMEQLAQVRRILRQMSVRSAQSIGDVAYIMQNRRQLRRLRWTLLVLALPIDLLEMAAIVWWVKTGVWLPFALWILFALAMGIWITRLYFTRVLYLCPECHRIFRPRFWEAFFARHTPYARKLTCIHCGHRGFCVEAYGKETPHAEN